MQQQDSAATFSGGVVVLFGTQVFGAAMGIFSGILLARLLGPDGKGDYYIVVLLPARVASDTDAASYRELLGYDYIGQDRQVLAMLPHGDARAVLERLDWGVVCDPDPLEVERAIEQLLTVPAPERPADPAGIYDRAKLARRLAKTFDDVVAAHEG